MRRSASGQGPGSARGLGERTEGTGEMRRETDEAPGTSAREDDASAE